MERLWKPNESSRLKLKVKKRNSLSGRALKAKVEGKPLSPLSNILNGRPRKEAGNAKRRNPFQCDKSDEKRTKYEEPRTDDKENDFSLFKAGIIDRETRCLSPQVLAEIDFENSDGKSRLPKNETTASDENSGDFFPTDWSLKTKIRFKSDVPFSWCTNLKSNHASKGTVNFVRCIEESILAARGTTDRETAFKVDFRKNLSYWKHPTLPCVPSFPLLDDSQLSEKSSTNICKDPAMRESIMKTWTVSFQSAFTLSKCGFCPYFYMCCQKFSCLFIGTNILCDSMVAIITPTTKGLRDLLQKEGIEYEMPHLNKVGHHNTETDDHSTAIENGDDETDEDFLSSIGLNKKQFSSIEKQRFANEISKLNAVDNRAQSTVLVKDYHVNALFNFFVNSDAIMAQSGAWQGVPPTLLSPVAFEGASLQTLHCIQGPMRVPYKGGLKQVNCLEVTGPILPTQFYNICQLVREANESFEATIYSSSHSNGFNCQMEKTQESDNHSDIPPEFGINKSSLEYLRKFSLLNVEALVQLQFSNGLFAWKTHSNSNDNMF